MFFVPLYICFWFLLFGDDTQQTGLEKLTKRQIVSN
jgi:hypothetical protein